MSPVSTRQVISLRTAISLVALVILWGAVIVLMGQCLHTNRGEFAYTLDDAYIHLAIAKNFAGHGVFGITPFEFSSAESSPLWGMVLTVVAKLIPDPHLLVYAPFGLNLFIASAGILLAHRGYSEGKSAQWASRIPALAFGGFLLLIALIFVTPLPWLIFSGMEHVLQCVLVASFVYLSTRRLAEEMLPPLSSRDHILLILAPLVTTIRYEGMFPLACVCALFLLRRRPMMAFALVAAGILPLLLFGFVSVSQGSFWLPNSVILKGRFGDAGIQALIDALPHPLFLFQLRERPYLALLVVASLVLTAIRMVRFRSDVRKGFWNQVPLFTLCFVSVTALNLQSALLRPLPGGFTLWFVRYDAWLVVLGLLATALAARDLIADAVFFPLRFPLPLGWGAQSAGQDAVTRLFLRPLCAALVLFGSLATSLILVDRAHDSIIRITDASHNIYSQQWQMARFVRRFYPGGVVALNDIGAVNYLVDIRLVDLVGLATVEIAKAKIDQTFNTRKIRSIASAHGAQIAIVYTRWFPGSSSLPKEWALVGSWKIPRNVICGDDTVSFYAVNATAKDRLASDLRNFSPSLPPDVLVEIYNYERHIANAHARVPPVKQLPEKPAPSVRYRSY